MEKIISGVRKFQSSVFGSYQSLFEELATGQHPRALFITCSDSRIDPNLVTQTTPGELFVLRNAGNIVPPYGAANGGEGATIEYALTALNIRSIIVCGHSHCGAMGGLLQLDKLANMPLVSSWLRHAEATRRVVLEKHAGATGEDLVLEAAKENVLMQLENLQTHPAVAAGLATNKLKLYAWVYEIENGQVLAYDPLSNQFLPLTKQGQSFPNEQSRAGSL